MMKKFFSTIFILLVVANAFVFSAIPVLADDAPNYSCLPLSGSTNDANYTYCHGLDQTGCGNDAKCKWGACVAGPGLSQYQSICNQRAQCTVPDASTQFSSSNPSSQVSNPAAMANLCSWQQTLGVNTSAIIPACALQDKLVFVGNTVQGQCGDISIYVYLLLQISTYLFSIIGALAIAAFIYGGVLVIISEGNPEKLKQGTDAILAAVIGLVVVFGAYLLIRYLGQVIELKNMFTLA